MSHNKAYILNDFTDGLVGFSSAEKVIAYIRAKEDYFYDDPACDFDLLPTSDIGVEKPALFLKRHGKLLIACSEGEMEIVRIEIK